MGLGLLTCIALIIGMPIGNWVGRIVHAENLKLGIAILLVVLGTYSLINFTIREVADGGSVRNETR